MQFVIEDWPFGQPFPKGNARTSSRGWWDKNLGFHVYSGATLPKELRPYRSKDFSLARWCEDEINGTVIPTTPDPTRSKEPSRSSTPMGTANAASWRLTVPD